MRDTIVYIEDDQENLELVARLLEGTKQYDVVGALDGASGLLLVEKLRPALVLVDLEVPKMNGFEITRRLKSSDDPTIVRIPVAAVSAHILKDEKNAALAAGCAAFFEKPFDIRSFRTEIARLIAESRR